MSAFGRGQPAEDVRNYEEHYYACKLGGEEMRTDI
jgi:hypothetical protein